MSKRVIAQIKQLYFKEKTRSEELHKEYHNGSTYQCLYCLEDFVCHRWARMYRMSSTTTRWTLTLNYQPNTRINRVSCKTSSLCLLAIKQNVQENASLQSSVHRCASGAKYELL